MNCLLCGKTRQPGSLLCTDCKRGYRLGARPAVEQARMRSAFQMAVIARRYKVKREREAKGAN